MIFDFENLGKIKEKIEGKQTVLVGGCFDVFHFGHLEFLKKAKEQGDYLIVVLEPDEVIRLKKREPVHNHQERAQVLDSMAMVDLVIKIPKFGEKDYWHLVEDLKPNVIAVTEGDSQIENKKKQAESVGGELKVVTPFIKDFSSTKITNHASISRS